MSTDSPNSTAHTSDIQMPSRKYPLDCPTRYAISAHTATPKKPDTAGCNESRRTSRHSRTRAAAPTALPIAGRRPPTLDAITNVTTGWVIAVAPNPIAAARTTEGFGTRCRRSTST